MSVVKINAISVPEGMGPQLEGRFAQRAKLVDGTPGFQGFQLLRPVAGDDRYFVVTHWDNDESFRAWTDSSSFKAGHAEQQGGPRPVGMDAALLEFEVVDLDALNEAGGH